MNTILTFLKQLDKQLHMLGCFALMMMLGYWLAPSQGLIHSVAIAAAVTLSIGACKEWYDYKHPLTHTADWFDFLADSIGVAAGSLVLLAPLACSYLRAY